MSKIVEARCGIARTRGDVSRPPKPIEVRNPCYAGAVPEEIIPGP